MQQYDYDLLVIGAGSAGVRLARFAAQYGARVAIVESRYLGGTCVNVGCVPKKLFVYAAQFSAEVAGAAGYGWQVSEPTLDWAVLRDNKTREIDRLNQIYENLLHNAGVTVLRGHARILGPHEVQVDEQTLSCERIAITTGGWPQKNTYPGAELAITSNEVFALEQLPKRVLVEGGGYIAVEFAGIFNGLGCSTELIYRGPLFMRGFDEDVRSFLAEQMREKGVDLRFNCEIQSITQVPGGLQVQFVDGGSTEVDCVFSALGRRPMLDDLGLENTSVCLTKAGTVAVNEQFQTDEPSIYALGDVVGHKALTPVALEEAMALAGFLYDKQKGSINYDTVPTAVFSQPELATVGLSEAEAINRGHQVQIFRSEFRPLKHTLSGLAERALIKLVVDRESQRVLGCHMVGEHGAEIIQGLAIAVNMGATKQDFDRTLGVHPSLAEEFVTMRNPA